MSGPNRIPTLRCHSAALSALLTLLCASGIAQTCPEDVVARERGAAVFIHVKKTLKGTGAVEERFGTGVVISPSGYVLTSRHVIEADNRVDEIDIGGLIGSRKANGCCSSDLRVVAKNEHDVALLKFEDTSKIYKYVPIGHPSEVNLSTTLCSLSFPKNQEIYYGSGAKSGDEGPNWTTTMASNPGDSGAGVFVASGDVVALKYGGYDDAQSINLLVPINLANDLLMLVPDLGQSCRNCLPEGNAGECPSFAASQGDESALALLAEKAFSQQHYVCVITYLEQAKRVQASKVWERDYPYLAAAYLLGRQDRAQFESSLQEMLGEMRLNHSYLHHGPPIGMALQNLTDVRQYLDRQAQGYIDNQVIPEALKIKAGLGS